MTGLDWFQAYALAVNSGQAIRRAAWQYWLISWGSNIWVIDSIDPTTGIESQRIVLNTDFGVNEFLAKDWTNETWEGGSYPPCTQTAPATALPPNAGGGWTLTPADCDGGPGGQGTNNIPVVPIDGATITPPESSFVFRMEPRDVYANNSEGTTDDPVILGYSTDIVYGGYSGPDGPACWYTPPVIGWSFVPTLPFTGTTGTRLYFQIAPPGVNLHGSSPSLTPITGVISFPVSISYEASAAAAAYYTLPSDFALALDDGGGAFCGPKDATGSDQYCFTAVTPSQTWQGRVINTDSTGVTILGSYDCDYTFEPYCIGS